MNISTFRLERRISGAVFLLLAAALLSTRTAFAGALGVRLGGPTQYRYQLEIRPSLGEGPAPVVADLRRAVRLSRLVQAAALLVALAVGGVVQRRRP